MLTEFKDWWSGMEPRDKLALFAITLIVVVGLWAS